ncbi:hypothetical protein GCAAIG_03200 [Candidatus Electronema halotolerans]
MKLHPQIIQKEGKNEFMVLPFAEFEAITEILENYEDLRELREAKEQAAGQKPVPLHEVIAELGLRPKLLACRGNAMKGGSLIVKFTRNATTS